MQKIPYVDEPMEDSFNVEEVDFNPASEDDTFQTDSEQWVMVTRIVGEKHVEGTTSIYPSSTLETSHVPPAIPLPDTDTFTKLTFKIPRDQVKQMKNAPVIFHSSETEQSGKTSNIK